MIIYCVIILDQINCNWLKEDEEKAKELLYHKTIKDCEIIQERLDEEEAEREEDEKNDIFANTSELIIGKI